MVKREASETNKSNPRPEARIVEISDLHLDLENYRTTPQENEAAEYDAFIRIKPQRVWGLMESLLDDGYLPTENIIVIDDGEKLIVKEGNRRVGALKIITGKLKVSTDLPDHIQKKINSKTKSELDELTRVPCNIYTPQDARAVDRIIELTHAKSESASRDNWSAISRARHSYANGGKEYGYVLISKFMKDSTKLKADTKIRWSGEYPISVLDDIMKKKEFTAIFGAKNAEELAKKYPQIDHRERLDQFLTEIGEETIGFKQIRGDALKQTLASLKDDSTAQNSKSDKRTSSAPASATSGQPAENVSLKKVGSEDSHSSSESRSSEQSATPAKKSRRPKASNDVTSVTEFMRDLEISGKGTEKLEAIRQEMLDLDLNRTPFAYAYLLRSFLEIAAKNYIMYRPGLKTTVHKPSGDEKMLMVILRDLIDEIAPPPKGPAYDALDKAAQAAVKQRSKDMHPSKIAVTSDTSYLSINGLNTAVHHGRFHIVIKDLVSEFRNLTPLIEELVRGVK
ncbi:hypothetical protein WDJ50_02800 [Deinococcus sp. VB142]|uniref:ParB/Sulfiredoxin domain-containing protein n=1 Tax=Deinococcus sp. VB142 TaxID=3112952 RepID=A0AAU6Q3U0_9DEIO